MAVQDWSIQEVARLSGISSRTLRHYHQIGLLEPSRIGPNGYRFYDADVLLRLQTLLLLREQGLGLPDIAKVLNGSQDAISALKAQRDWLAREQQRLTRQMNSITITLEKFERKEQAMAEEMFDGFDNSQYQEEVEERWGKQAYADSDRWWKGQSDEQKRDWQMRIRELMHDWKAAHHAALLSTSEQAQALAKRQYEWLSAMPGVPRESDGRLLKEYFIGLGEMYIADPRFAENYGGVDGATFVSDAMKVYAERNL